MYTSKCDVLKDFVAPKMTGFTALIEKHGKEVSYYASDINYIYSYLEMIGSPTNLTYSIWHSQFFGLNTNTDTESLHPVIAALRVRQGIICECCVCPRHKSDYCIIIGPNLLPSGILRNNNQ